MTKRDGEKKSILPLSGREETARKQAVRTTIVGGQPPGNERPLQQIPIGIEQILAMAAVDDKFAAALLENREAAMKASGVEVTATEKGILTVIDNAALRQMIENVRGRIPVRERRAFLKKSAAALLALVGGGFLTTASLAEAAQEAAGGVRADRGARPDKPATKGIRPDRPAPPREEPVRSRPSVPTWTEVKSTAPKDDKELKKSDVFDCFDRIDVNKNAAPFLIYFYKPGRNESNKEVKKCADFEKALDDASDVRKAAMDFGRYVCDASGLNKKTIKKFNVKTPGIVIFDCQGKKVHTITSIPKKTKSLIKKLGKIKEASDKLVEPEPDKEYEPAPRAPGGIRADRPEKKEPDSSRSRGGHRAERPEKK
ncbi:MAG: twin-arginine translocation signal domain-containing protein [Planctomycetota bacterium]|nr:MAG: twin-arginine translocation signal domain-containing protein [Planctomycetota bacterium]